MKKKIRIIRIITIVVFVLASIPITTCLRKGNEKEVEFYKNARKVDTEQAFAEALKTDGWIYAKGAFVGKAPLEKLNEGSRTLSFNSLLTNKKTAEQIANNLKGDFLRVRLVIGEVERENNTGPFTIYPTYTAITEAEEITFLGQQFDAKKILPISFRKEKIEYPENGSSMNGFELELIKSPYETWIKVLAADGKMVDKGLSLIADEHMQNLKATAEGKNNRLNTYTIAGFLGFWLILLIILLLLEGRWIKN